MKNSRAERTGAGCRANVPGHQVQPMGARITGSAGLRARAAGGIELAHGEPAVGLHGPAMSISPGRGGIRAVQAPRPLRPLLS